MAAIGGPGEVPVLVDSEDIGELLEGHERSALLELFFGGGFVDCQCVTSGFYGCFVGFFTKGYGRMIRWKLQDREEGVG